MTKEQRKNLEKDEEFSAERVAERYGLEVNGYSYLSLMLDAIHKISLDLKIVSLCDKFNGGGEAWHEVFAANINSAQ